MDRQELEHVLGVGRLLNTLRNWSDLHLHIVALQLLLIIYHQLPVRVVIEQELAHLDLSNDHHITLDNVVILPVELNIVKSGRWPMPPQRRQCQVLLLPDPVEAIVLYVSGDLYPVIIVAVPRGALHLELVLEIDGGEGVVAHAHYAESLVQDGHGHW